MNSTFVFEEPAVPAVDAVAAAAEESALNIAEDAREEQTEEDALVAAEETSVMEAIAEPAMTGGDEFATVAGEDPCTTVCWKQIVCGGNRCQGLRPCIEAAGCAYQSDWCVSEIIHDNRGCQALEQCEKDRLGPQFHCPSEAVMNSTFVV